MSQTYAGASCIVCKRNIRYLNNDDCRQCKPRGESHRAMSKSAKLKKIMRNRIEQHQIQDRGEYYID